VFVSLSCPPFFALIRLVMATDKAAKTSFVGELKGFRKEGTRVRVAYAIFDRMIRHVGATVSYIPRWG
jgi:hypothetical protein